MANIGRELEEIEVIPLNAPVEAPAEAPGTVEPAREPAYVPAEQPTREQPEPVPAGFLVNGVNFNGFLVNFSVV